MTGKFDAASNDVCMGIQEGMNPPAVQEAQVAARFQRGTPPRNLRQPHFAVMPLTFEQFEFIVGANIV